MRVLLVDDHALFMEGLKNLLIANDIEVVGMAMKLGEAVRKAEELTPDVILMDVQMPGGDGIEATRLIKGNFPEVKIVMLTVSQDDNHLFEAIKAGASGYLLKGLPKKQFLEQLEELAKGESPLAPGLATKILNEFARREQERQMAVNDTNKIFLLSAQQVDILRLVAQGLTYKRIGSRLYLSEVTVKYHMRKIMSLLYLENRAQVIAYALESGLVISKE